MSVKSKRIVNPINASPDEVLRLREDLMRIRRDAISVVRQVEAILGLEKKSETNIDTDKKKDV